MYISLKAVPRPVAPVITPTFTWDNQNNRPMHRIAEGICSLAQHLINVITDPEQYRPAACSHCGYARVVSV
jgi:hypothetical protein